ncbi:sigma-w pathway protein ysdB [Bacillaceae bacterium Marseille-Q3522]|nr:sigma-w pathway protein ysdB [Bacillaceae bacterium Marseille-Q3522]
MMWLIRILLIVFILILIYSTIKYIRSPKRRMEFALEKKRFYLMDDKNNIRKNFYLTYKGVLFEGEKYIDPEENVTGRISIFIWPQKTESLTGMLRKDFDFIELQLRHDYPDANIDWKSPIKDFLLNSDQQNTPFHL